MNGSLHLMYLGGFEVRRQVDEQEETLPKPPTLKSQALLAYLAYWRERPHPRERLMGMFWGDRPARNARRSLSTALWHIRRCFSDVDPIQADNQAVQFRFAGAVWLDVEAFARHAAQNDAAGWQAAADLYQGDFLDGFYDDWVIEARYQLQALYLEVLTYLMRHYEAAGQPQAALQTALTLIAQDNLREEAHRLAMRAYIGLGQRHAALEQYRICQQILAAELDIEPMAETTALHQAIVSGEYAPAPVLGAPSLPVKTSLTTSARHPLDAAAEIPLVGRSQELSFLQAQWQQARSGHGSLVSVSGEAGVGKTRLLKALAQEVWMQGAPVLMGRCYEFERLLPYQPIAEALRPLLTGTAKVADAQVPGWVQEELARLMPELPLQHSQPQTTQTAEDQTRLFSAVAHFLEQLTKPQPLLLLVEDLHWATESTLGLLHFLVRRLGRRPILFIATYRQEMVGRRHPLRAIERQMRQSDLVQRLHLSPLSPEAVNELVQALSGQEEAVRPLADRLYQETEGNPFFLMEMIKALFERGIIYLEAGLWQGPFDRLSQAELPMPPGITEAVQARVQRLSPDAQEALRLAAILGQEFDFDLLNAVWQKGEEASLAALDDLLRARLIEEGTGLMERDYAFTHHKIQEAVYTAMPRRRRQYRHARAARSMEALYENGIEPWVGELGYHFEQGSKIDRNLTGKAITHLRRAGEQAAARFALDEAAAYFSRALALTTPEAKAERYRLLMARVQMYNWQARREAQAQDLDALEQLVATLLGEAEGITWQAELALRQVDYAEATADYPAGIAAAENAIRLAQASGVAEVEATGYLKLGVLLYRQGEYQAAHGHLGQALMLARAASLPEIEGTTRQGQALVCWAQGDYEQSATHARAALEQFRQSGNHRNAGITLLTLGNIHQYQSNHDQARSYFEQSLEIFREIGDRRHEGFALGNLGVVTEGQGDYEAAGRYHEQSLTLSREIGDQRQEALSQYNLGAVALELGQYTRAQSYLENCLTISREVSYRRGEGAALRELGRVAADQGGFTVATDYLRRALSIYRELGERRGEGLTVSYFSRLLTRLGDYEEARARGRESLALLREIGSQIGECLSLNVLSVIECEQGRFEAAYDLSQQALPIAQGVDSRNMQAYCLTLSGDALAGLGRRAEADEAYRAALVLWKTTGQTHLAAAALAGRALVALAQEEPAEALTYVAALWHRLEAGGLAGVDSPGRIYLTCYRVLRACQDDRARVLLNWAHDLLHAQATTIEGERRRQRFLEKIAAHRELAAAYATLD